MSKISQREARRLKKRVEQLEAADEMRRNSWRSDWPGGVNVDTIRVNDTEFAIADTARKLGHAIVVVPRKNADKFEFLVYACELPK